ncbi:hypothetical protein Prubr_27300 [Polymorphospora rubra]|uniref:Methyltransferase n=1 Tax=Polymorphospora rubra TaxID=338584 RepID=A0A810N0G2_9ACTN|nr:hypothetical protein Prubr_27300 [Polymorphospora rubra]
MFLRHSAGGVVQVERRGGPFGFDITVAHQVEHMIREGELDGIVETGSFVGDTLEYLGRRYPWLPVVGIEIDPDYAAVARRRTDDLANVEVRVGDSAELLADSLRVLRRPLVYLDAHWGEDWPLAAELGAINRGFIAVDDVDIADPRFGYDQYGDVRLDPDLLRVLRPDLEWYVGAPRADYPHPCLQVGRRTGTAYAAAGGVDPDVLAHTWFTRPWASQRLQGTAS